ncbi:MAG: methyltransferase domain-containing protein [Spirochaetia bacterium]|jgi:ubiquinone/menaquinone biosynthesis C-methylase UbiE
MSREDEHSRLNAEKWNRRAKTYDRRRFDFMRFMQSRTLHLIDVRKGMSFLDIGCGTGWAVRRTAQLLNGVGKFYGIDISPQMIEKANEQTLKGRNIKFKVGNAEELPFGNGTFDVVLCTNSFHHYKNPKKVLTEMARVLKSDGAVYITDLTADSLISRIIDNRQRKIEKEHVRFYGTKDYQKMFSQVGLTYIGQKTITVTLMKVHMGRRMDDRKTSMRHNKSLQLTP